MSGESGPTPIAPISLRPIGPYPLDKRPPCATPFQAALEHPENAQEALPRAIEAAKDSTLNMCANCLGRAGLTLCPLLWDEPVTVRGVQIASEDTRAVRTLVRALEGRTQSPVADAFLQVTLFALRGIPRSDRRHPDNKPPITPEKPRKAPPSLETRPKCAEALAEFAVTRRERIDKHKAAALEAVSEQRGRSDPKDESASPVRIKIEPIAHEKHSDLIYNEAIRLSQVASPTDCKNCLGENCPLKNGVPPKTWFDSVSKASTKGLDEPIKTVRYILQILAGSPRNSIPAKILSKIDRKLANRVKEKGGTYKPPPPEDESAQDSEGF